MASLRENMGYHATLFSGHKQAVMIFSPEQALFKAQADHGVVPALLSISRGFATHGRPVCHLAMET